MRRSASGSTPCPISSSRSDARSEGDEARPRESPPQEIQHTRFSDPKGAHRCYRAGIVTPVAPEGIVQVNGIAGVGFGVGLYPVQMTFLDSDGRESEPRLLVTIEITGGTLKGWRLENVPRSPEPQVVARRFYVPASGGGTAILHSTLTDNESNDVEIIDPPATGLAIVIGNRNPAPKGRFITVSRGALVISHLSTELGPAGPSSFAWSGLSPTQFPGEQIVSGRDRRA